MATITGRKGNVLAEVPDTLEDWKQAAEVEAGIRREFQQKFERAKAALELHDRLAQLDEASGDEQLWTESYREACEATRAVLSE